LSRKVAQKPVEIRGMTETDLAAADELRRRAGWNQTPEDWRMLLSFEPEGCFVAVQGNRVIGTVTTTTYGHETAWIGMMLVHPDHQRQGIGTQLMHRALDYLKSCGICCIRLDATPAGRPVYEKLGFVAEWSLTRHQRSAGSTQTTGQARRLEEADWPTVENLDAAAFGVARGRILRALAETSRCALVTPRKGPINGFGMLRRGSHCDYVGPLVGDDAALVWALLEYAEGRAVFWDVPNENAAGVALAKTLGFAAVRPLIRMRHGPNTVTSDSKAQLAIADPSLG